MTLTLKGLGVSQGVAIGAAHLLRRRELETTEYTLPESKLKAEINRLRQALKLARKQLRSIKNQIPAETADDIGAFIDTHLLMLEDSTLTKIPEKIIRERRCNAEWALQLQRDHLIDVFDGMEDPYLRTRQDDIDHVVNRVQNILQSNSPGHETPQNPFSGQIVLADDLSPADTILMRHQGISGFITERGGPMSHTAILARSLGIPAIVGAHGICRFLRNGETLILDGDHGLALANPAPITLRSYKKIRTDAKQAQRNLHAIRDVPAITIGGTQITLMANIELPSDIRNVTQCGADGVGLYRTEFMYMNRPLPPNEEEQLQQFRKVLRALKGNPLTIRTLDVGADKPIESIRCSDSIPANPALSLRAIRLCLKNLELFRPQLRAILRASAFGPVRLMIPMLSSLNELLQVKALLKQVKGELEQDGIGYDLNIPLGAIIEVPATAIAADLFAKHVDFFSIGTNDLIQYTLAIDRIDDEVNYLYDPLHPAVLRLIQMTIMAGKKAGIPVAMCGEMAGDTQLTRLLIGMGLTEFSMPPNSILKVKSTIHTTRDNGLDKLARKILKCDTPAKLHKHLGRINSL